MNQVQLKNLRAEGKVEEAYKLTKLAYASNTTDIWAIRNHAWSIYYMVKKHAQAGQAQQAGNFLNEFEEMNIPQDEKLIFERFGYFQKVLKADYLKSKELVDQGEYVESFDLLVNSDQIESEQIAWTMFYLLRAFNKTGKPQVSEIFKRLDQFIEKVSAEKKVVFKLILQQLIKISESEWMGRIQSGYLEHFLLFDVLEDEDYQKQDWEGKKIMSLAERLHITYSKALLREKASSEKIKKYIGHIVEPVLEQFKGMQYVPYFKAKLLLGLGERDTGLEAFLPFARRKATEFWVWQVFAEVYDDDEAIYSSCLCKALTCRTKPEFLLGVKERLLAFLISKKRFEEAKSELEDILQIRASNGWGKRSKHQDYLDSDWYVNNQPLKMNYRNYVSQAESLLRSNQETEIKIVVTHINENKKVFGFLTEGKKQGFSKYQQKPKLWACYRLRGEFSKGDFFKISEMEEVGQVKNLIQEIEGKLKIIPGKAFGFLGQAFVESDFIKKNQLSHGDHIQGEAISQPVKGKEGWGLKLVKMTSKV